jgi:glycosyltransferase involved in cell wall biosynthesis
LNEAAAVGGLLDSLAQQTRRPDQVVIVDGGSTDGTLELLEDRAATGDLALEVLSRPGVNISAGRNAGVRSAHGPLIACTDAGVRLVPEWLEELSTPLASGAQFVSGWFVADPIGAFETALGAATLPHLREIDPESFLPSSRSVAFDKDAWAAAGGYPEWLDYCEDLIFDFRMLGHVGKPVFAPRAVARFRPRPTATAFARQYYRYARGDGKADLWRARHAVRYGVYLVLVPLLLLLSAVSSPWWLAVLGVGLAAMLRRPYRRLVGLWGNLPTADRLTAILWVPPIRVIGDIAKMVGYPVGLAWRRRVVPPEWKS